MLIVGRARLGTMNGKFLLVGEDALNVKFLCALKIAGERGRILRGIGDVIFVKCSEERGGLADGGKSAKH